MERLAARFSGRVGFLLIVAAGLNFGYPLTLYLGALGDVAYLAAYALMFLIGVLVTSADRAHFARTGWAALFWLGCAIALALNPASAALTILAQAALLPCLLLLMSALLKYIYTARVINRQVLLAAITVYVFLAMLFAPVYTIINTLDPGAFVDNGLGAPVHWPQLVYFSFITLATVGYGDVLPLNPWARSLAAAEGMLGVLYVALIMGRLVGVYSQERRPAAREDR